MEKTYRISYKTYQNDRLKKVDFHGKAVYPLYIQLTFDRKTTFYKSSFFDLFSQPKYSVRVAGDTLGGPTLQAVIDKENDLIDFIIEKHQDNFSLELFKREYDFYCHDLLDIMEPAFLDYLHSFFQDEGMPSLADALKAGSLERKMNDVVEDMKLALKPDLYAKLIENSFYLAPPYLLLYSFAAKWRSKPPVSLTFKDWEQKNVKEAFIDFMNRTYPDKQILDILREIQKWEKAIRITSR